jgi:hypothetical protein
VWGRLLITVSAGNNIRRHRGARRGWFWFERLILSDASNQAPLILTTQGTLPHFPPPTPIQKYGHISLFLSPSD